MTKFEVMWNVNVSTRSLNFTGLSKFFIGSHKLTIKHLGLLLDLQRFFYFTNKANSYFGVEPHFHRHCSCVISLMCPESTSYVT